MMYKKIIIVSLTFMSAMLLMIVPLPNWAIWARPEWVFLVLMFWIMEYPEQVGVGVAWAVGLLMDLLTGTILGLHAFVFTLITYLVIKFHPQLRNFPLWQQSLMIFVLAMLNLALQYWILGLIGTSPGTWAYWLPALTSINIWPWESMLLREWWISTFR